MFLSNPLFLLLSTLSSLTQFRSFAAEVAGTPLGATEASLNASIQSLLGSTSLTSKILQNFLAPLAVEVARNSNVVRDGAVLKLNGVHWTASGANVYWLGLDENVIPPIGQPFYAKFNASYPTHGRITEVMNTLATMGARTIRSQTLGVSVGNPLSVMPVLGVYNEQAFDTIDWAVFQARQHGLRIMAPLIDNYDYYHGGKFNFLRFRGFNVSSANNSVVPSEVMQFYTNATIVQDFKDYVRHLITHVNPYTGLSYAEDPTIFAYETGNELGGTRFGDMDVPNEWTSEISSFVKSLAPHKLIVDGTYGVNKTHLSIETVDIYSDHYYPLNNTKLRADIALVAAAVSHLLPSKRSWDCWR
jgi:mannan endo-1,4-beta-mannosidase